MDVKSLAGSTKTCFSSLSLRWEFTEDAKEFCSRRRCLHHLLKTEPLSPARPFLPQSGLSPAQVQSGLSPAQGKHVHWPVQLTHLVTRLESRSLPAPRTSKCGREAGKRSHVTSPEPCYCPSRSSYFSRPSAPAHPPRGPW